MFSSDSSSYLQAFIVISLLIIYLAVFIFTIYLLKNAKNKYLLIIKFPLEYSIFLQKLLPCFKYFMSLFLKFHQRSIYIVLF